MNPKIEKICLTIIRWGSYLILFIPLLVYSRTLYPYIFGKIIYFRILVEIIFAAWLFLAIYDKKYRPNWKNPLLLSLTIFIAGLVLTMFTGVNIKHSFWSSQERMTGVLTMLHFWLWFLVLTGSFKSWSDWQKIIILSSFACFLVGLYGLGQRIGLKFLLKETDVLRLSSTLGNPIYLGVYSMLHIFLVSLLLIYEKKWLWRGLEIFLLIFYLIIMFLAATRGVLVAFAFAIFFFLLFYVFSLPPGRNKKILMPIFIILTIIIFAGGAFLQTQNNKPWVKKMPFFIQRMTQLTQQTELRTVAWQTGLKGFKEKPIFGWGWENFNIIFNKYYNPFWMRFGAEMTWFDRSHNQIVDLLALTGILGTLAYLAMYGIIFWLLLKKQSKMPEYTRITRIGQIILAMMFLAYFIQNIFVFDTPAPLIVFYFSLGLVYSLTSNNEFTKNLPITNKKPNTKVRGYQSTKIPLPLLIFLIIIFLPWGLYKFNFEPFQQSRAGIKAHFISRANPKIGLEWYKKALAKPVFTNHEIRMLMAKDLYEQQNKISPSLFKEFLDFTISELEKSTKEHPFDARAWLNLGQIYSLGGQFYGRIYFEKAENTLKKALVYSPKRQQIYYELIRVKLMTKEYPEAVRLAEEVTKLDEQVKDSQWFLALAYLHNNQTELGLATLDKAYDLGYPIYQDSSMDAYIAKNYAKIGQYGKAINFINEALRSQPYNLEYLSERIRYYWPSDQAYAKQLIEDLRKLNSEAATKLEQELGIQ